MSWQNELLATFMQHTSTFPKSVAPADVRSARRDFETTAARMPRPPGVTYEADSLGGVPVEWAIPDAHAPERVLVYFHGGGYLQGSPATHRALVGRLALAASARAVSVDYRMGPEAPFPAAVEDACAVLQALAGMGVPPTATAVAGDSAGGGLAAAALIATREAGATLPGAALLLSPWTDLALTGESIRGRARRDPMLTEEHLRIGVEGYLAGADPRGPLASPLHADLRGLPPLLVHVGGREIIHDDSSRFVERARAAGVDATLEVWEPQFHIWHFFAPVLPEAREAITRAGDWLRGRLD